MKSTIYAVFLLGSAVSPHAWARGIYVDSNASMGGTGSADAPFQTIAQAMEQARQIRKTDFSKIVIRVAPGVYNENFPIYVNVSNISLRGSTHLIEDDDDLPANCGTSSAPDPCIEPGTETLIMPLVRLPSGQSLFTLAPTRDDPSNNLADITVSGFVFDGKGDYVDQLDGTSIALDRVDNFFIHHNVIRTGRPGMVTCLSSGRIQGNFAYNNNEGIAVAAGSEVYPARVELIGNRSMDETATSGAIAIGACGENLRQDPNLPDFSALIDRAVHPEEVKDKLAILVTGNDFSYNMFGMRFQEYDGFYDTAGNQPMTGNITATVRNNWCQNDGDYGLLVEGAFAIRSNPREFTGTFNGSFENNNCTGPGRTGVFVGFMLNGQVTRNASNINTYKYLQDSQFILWLDDATLSTGLDYDNPVLDPFDKQTPLNNQLLVNGEALSGKRVTCPQGFPCVP
jgi:hypothetical protein